MPSSDPTPIALTPVPDTRECRPGGFQALLCPNGKDTYFVAELQASMLGEGEPLTRFLPRAVFTPAGQGRSGGRVVYKLPEEARGGGARLKPPHGSQAGDRLLPRSEIEAFAVAVQAFLHKAQLGDGGLSHLEKQCRRDLKLPDPNTDPDAYWVYGGDFDRKLLILWGCERLPRSSLTLDQVVQSLLTREMAWEDKQELALKLALRDGEPLARFLGVRTADGKCWVEGKLAPDQQLQRFERITAGESKRFAQAAREFYSRGDEKGVPLFERELRQDLRLPDLELSSGSFYTWKSRFVIMVDRWARADTVLPVRPPPGAKPATPYGSTGPLKEAGARAEVPLAEQLEARVRWQPATWMRYAAAAVVMLGISCGVFAYFFLGNPPKLSSKDPTFAGDRVIVIKFDRKIAADSLKIPGAVTIAGDKRAVKEAAPDPVDPTLVRVTLDQPMEHKKEYAVTVSKAVTDTRGKHLVADTQTPSVLYTDNIDLVLDKVSAGATPNELLLVFTKPMKAKYSSDLATIAVSVGGKAGGEEYGVASIVRDIANPQMLVLITKRKFEPRVPYLLTLNNVEDMNDKVLNLKAKPFFYEDILEPAISGAGADFAALALDVSFNKRMNSSVMGEKSNYRLVRMEKETEVPLTHGTPRFDDASNRVSLPLDAASLKPGKYQIAIERMLGNNGKEKKADHPFEILPDIEPPKVKDTYLTPVDAPSRIEVEFLRALVPASFGQPGSFEVLNDRRESVGALSTPIVGRGPNWVVMNFGQPIGSGRYFLIMRNLESVTGGKLSVPTEKEFSVAGLGEPIARLLRWAKDPVRSGKRVVLELNCELTDASVKNVGNYKITPTAGAFKIEHIVVRTTPAPTSTVTLVFDSDPPAELKVSAKDLEIAGDRYPLQLLPTRQVR